MVQYTLDVTAVDNIEHYMVSLIVLDFGILAPALLVVCSQLAEQLRTISGHSRFVMQATII